MPTDSAPIPYTTKRQTTELFVAPQKNTASTESSLMAYGGVSTLNAVVAKLATSTAAVQWKLYRKSTDGRVVYEGVETRRQVTNHAALNILNRPNEHWTRQSFFERLQLSIDLTGEGWIVIERSKTYNLPIGLWLARSDRITVEKDADEYLTGYIYKTPDGNKIHLDKEDVIPILLPNPMDPYRGLAPAQALAVDLESARYAAAYNRNFFLNSAIPGGFIEVPDTVEDGAFDELRTRWSETHLGVANAHRIDLLEGGATFKAVQTNMKDMQFAELRELSRNSIMEAYTLPKFILGLVDDVNKANAIASKALYNEECISPRLDRIKSALNAFFLPMFPGGQDLEFDFELPQIEDPDTDASALQLRAQAVVALVTAGFDPEQACLTVGLPPMDFSKPEPPPAPEKPTQDPEQEGDDQESGGSAR